jgi:hypothetical protein
MALALPLDSGRSIRGEDITQSWWQSTPVAALLNFTVQPRSLAMFRAEEMLSMNGNIRLAETEGKRQVENSSALELRDAVLIESTGAGKRQERWLGTIKAGASVDIEPKEAEEPRSRIDAGPGPDPNPVLEALRSSWEDREEDKGEIRLVAWAKDALPGQLIEPAIDRKRGFTAVLVHLRSGPPPSPDGRRYNLLASGTAAEDAASVERTRAEGPAGRPAGKTARKMSPQLKSITTGAPAKGAPGK